MTQFQVTIGAKPCMVINYHNIHKNCMKMKYAFNDQIPIKCNITRRKQMKHQQMIIYAIGYEILIDWNLFFELKHYFTLNLRSFIKNWTLILNLLWYNPLIMKNIMTENDKYRLIFRIASYALRGAHLNSVGCRQELTHFMKTIVQTTIYLDLKHFHFMIELGLNESFTELVFFTYSSKQPNSDEAINIFKSFLCLTAQAYYISQKHNGKYQTMFDVWIEPVYKIISKLNTDFVRVLYIKCQHKFDEIHKIINEFELNLSKIKQINVKDYLRCCNLPKIVKKCGNHQCGKTDKMKLKICKGCKAIYYCKKKCQKSHWKSIHRLQCNKIRIRLDAMNNLYIQAKPDGYSVDFVIDDLPVSEIDDLSVAKI